MARALNANEFLGKKFEELEFNDHWHKSFGNPESNFSVLMYGKPKNGKTEYCTMLAKYMTKFGKVLYNSFEQGFSKSLQDAWRRQKLNEVSNRVLIVHKEPFDAMVARLKKKKSPPTVFIDSLQYIKMTYEQWQYLRNTFPRKRFIMICHAEGDDPKGGAAKAIEYDVDIMVLVKGFEAHPRSRFGGNEPYVFYEQGHINWLKRQGKEPRQKKEPTKTGPTTPELNFSPATPEEVQMKVV
jgi:hypothetical protein